MKHLQKIFFFIMVFATFEIFAQKPFIQQCVDEWVGTYKSEIKNGRAYGGAIIIRNYEWGELVGESEAAIQYLKIRRDGRDKIYFEIMIKYDNGTRSSFQDYFIIPKPSESDFSPFKFTSNSSRNIELTLHQITSYTKNNNTGLYYPSLFGFYRTGDNDFYKIFEFRGPTSDKPRNW